MLRYLDSTVMYKYIAFPIRIITFAVHIMDIIHVGTPTSIQEMSFLLLTGLCFVLHRDSALMNIAMRCSKPQKLFSKDVQFPDNPFPYYTIVMKYRDPSSSYKRQGKKSKQGKSNQAEIFPQSPFFCPTGNVFV